VTTVDRDEAQYRGSRHGQPILAHEGILDSFRRREREVDKDRTHFFMPRAIAARSGVETDIVEVTSDAIRLRPMHRRLNGERYIHCEIYKARDDVESVIHDHDLAVIPFGLTIFRSCSACSSRLPSAQDAVFEVREPTEPQHAEACLVCELGPRTSARGQARHQSCRAMRGHGETVVGRARSNKRPSAPSTPTSTHAHKRLRWRRLPVSSSWMRPSWRPTMRKRGPIVHGTSTCPC